MLYNRKWDRPTRAGFILWLERQDRRDYDYADIYECALGQYYKSLGLSPKRFADELFDDYTQQCTVLRELGIIECFT